MKRESRHKSYRPRRLEQHIPLYFHGFQNMVAWGAGGEEVGQVLCVLSFQHHCSRLAKPLSQLPERAA